MKLPAELRNYVYELVFTAAGPRELFILIERQFERDVAQPAITRSSRKLRQDSLPVFYRKPGFVLNLNYGVYSPKHAVVTAKWLRALVPETRSLVKGLVVHPGQQKDLLMTELGAGMLGVGQEQRVLIEAASAKMCERLKKAFPWMKREHVEEYQSITFVDARTYLKA